MSDTDPSVNRLPPEILVQIFRQLHATEDQPPQLYEWDASSDEAILKRAVMPYSISSVCRYWDKVSALAPELWDYPRILVSLGSHDGGSPAQMVERYMLRAPRNDAFIVHITSGDSPERNERRISERQTVTALLPILSAHLHQISELSILTRFASSLPPYAFLCPQPRVSQGATLQNLTVQSNESRSPDTVSLPPWPSSPIIVPYTLQLHTLDLSGLTFISFCQSRLHQVPHKQRQCTTLTARNLFQDRSAALSLDALLQLLEEVVPALRELVLVDVGLRSAPEGSSAQEDEIPDPQPTNLNQFILPTISLTRVNADTILGLRVSLCHRHAYQLLEMTLDDCTLPSHLDIPPIDITCLILHSFNVRSIINLLFAVDPSRNLMIMPTCNIGDGTEPLQQLETAGRDDGTPLLLNLHQLMILNHDYISLDALCQFVETKFAASSSSSLPLFQLGQLWIKPTLEDWERMKAEVSVTTSNSRVTVGLINLWK
ncbi:hypothetical protein BKA70DRAFT_1236729 [Coprinopsis sp. MPI-PUGE-AT-0042]|nr:hypothetical protein BKA70DRAFT_1236729 [Coprinopsis sp. MPI-PUGE-AT-0042]